MAFKGFMQSWLASLFLKRRRRGSYTLFLQSTQGRSITGWASEKNGSSDRTMVLVIQLSQQNKIFAEDHEIRS